MAKGDNLRVSEKELELGIGFALAANIGARILEVRCAIERLTSEEFHADDMSMGISKFNTVILRVSVIRGAATVVLTQHFFRYCPAAVQRVVGCLH